MDSPTLPGLIGGRHGTNDATRWSETYKLATVLLADLWLYFLYDTTHVYLEIFPIDQYISSLKIGESCCRSTGDESGHRRSELTRDTICN